MHEIFFLHLKYEVIQKSLFPGEMEQLTDFPEIGRVFVNGVITAPGVWDNKSGILKGVDVTVCGPH